MKNKQSLKYFLIILAILIIPSIILSLYHHNRKQSYIHDNNHNNSYKKSNSYSIKKYNIMNKSQTKDILPLSEKLPLIIKNTIDEVPLPPLEKLTSNYYDTDTSMYSLYLVNIAYYLNDEVPYDSSNNHEKAVNYIGNKIRNTLTSGQRFRIINILTFTGLIYRGYAGFIFEIYDPKPVLFIVLRGTKSIGDWINDFSTAATNPFWAPNIAVHYGFNKVYINESNQQEGIRNVLYEYFKNGKTLYGYRDPPTPDNTSKIIIAGHSLGSAVCNLIGADMSQNFPELRDISKIFCYAPPYVGDERFAELINKNKISYSGLFQIINIADIVTSIGELGGLFKRPKFQKFCFSVGSYFPIYSAFDHSIITYFEAVKLNREYFDIVKNYPLDKVCGLNFGLNFGYNLDKKDFVDCDTCK
jgi:hypothetical protein